MGFRTCPSDDAGHRDAKAVVEEDGPLLVTGDQLTVGSTARDPFGTPEPRTVRVDKAGVSGQSMSEVQVPTIAAERALLARELHDVVGHGLSLILLQLAAVGGEVEAGELGSARQRLSRLERTARETLAETRMLVDGMHTGCNRGGPQPGVSDLPALVEDASQAGARIELEISDRDMAVSAGLGLTVYRVVQEALTNVVRHSRPAVARVVLNAGPDMITVEVTDEGAERVVDGERGLGLRGMRERAAVYGGTFDAGPKLGGGYRVLATFPLPETGVAIRVVVVDDEALVRDGLRAIAELEDGIEVVGEADSGAEAVRLIEEVRPDVVLMDIQMSGMDGVEATRRILTHPDPPRVIILTTFDRNEYVYEAMRAGASAFLLKDVRRDHLTATIRAVVDGETFVAPTITRRLIETYCRGSRQPTNGSHPLAALTDREVEVMTCVAAGRSNAEVAAELFLAETTVKTHVARILSKLRLRDRVQMVVLAYECGLVCATGAATDSDNRYTLNR